MDVTRHAFRGEADVRRILPLIDAMPDTCRHVVDFPWRLSAPVINEGRDAAYWEDSEGRVVGFAAWQYYWAALDVFLADGPERETVEEEMFAWAEGRFRERDAERGYPLPYAVEYRDDDEARRRLAETHGFTLDDEGYVRLEHSLDTLEAVPTLPEGFVLRELRGEEEAEAYAEAHRAAFESTSMTAEWRRRTLRMPGYRPDLDLVIAAPDGTLAGFCVGWYAPTRGIAQIEPMGIHPRFQGRGLGRILLLEMLHRFKAVGARRGTVETNVGRGPARAAYEAVRFTQTHTILRKEKWVSERTDEDRSEI